MNDRRMFLRSFAWLGANAAAMPAAPLLAEEPASENLTSNAPNKSDREYWISVLRRLSDPILHSLSRGQLKATMPVEAQNSADRAKYSHLEAWGRLLAGIAPWLDLNSLEGQEAALQKEYIALAQKCMDSATDPASPDFMNFSAGNQPLVDAAFLAHGILRSPRVLWHGLHGRVQGQIVDALKSSRAVRTPGGGNNWVMFAAMVEIALHYMGEATIEQRLEGCVAKMLACYKGDGAYGDGPNFRFDYYNAFVIHPMLIDVLALLKDKEPRYILTYNEVLSRARRYAAVQERMIAPDGTFPPVGRSLTYRFGALQVLAQMALRSDLPPELKPAQVRCALTSVIRRIIEARGTFDDAGPGLCGYQPSLAEAYISTGSLYLCSVGLLPLGLPREHEFWSGAPEKWTSQKIWSGESLPADKSLSEKL
ncbi:MAG: DUF2264 domain-containing protein [Proteobacteria bacterium]|nr:DUF2264 domain-containing protein [Pseudomonadota bacterium]